MFIFGLHSTSDDRPSDPSNEHQPKCKKTKKKALGQVIQVMNIDQNAKKNDKRPPKSSKNEMFIFGLRSTSDDQPSDLSDEGWPKHKKTKKGPQSHQKIKCLFLDYVQLLMIGQVI